MAFPADADLDIQVEAYLGDAEGWVDLSDRLLGDVKVKRGAGDGAATASAESATVVLDNDDGSMTPLYALSPYYPHVTRGAPARIAIRRVHDLFDRTVSPGWGTATSGQTWSASAGASVAPGEGRHTHAASNTLVRTSTGALADVEQVSDVTVPAAITGAAMVSGHMARFNPTTGDYYWLRLEFNAGGSTTTLKISKQVDNVGTDLAVLSGAAGLTYAAGQPLRIRSLVYGPRLAVKAWDPGDPEPRDWMLTATDGDLTGPGRYGCQTWLVAGNTNTLPFAIVWAEYSAQVGRLVGEIASFRAGTKPSTDGELVNTTTIQIAGVVRRLGQGNPPADSPMRRSIAAAGPLAYWPLEDEPDATEGASAVDGVPNMTVAGTVDFGAGNVSTSAGGTFRYGTKALPSLLAGGALYGTVPAGVSSPVAWAVHTFWEAATGDDDDVVLQRWRTSGGTHAYWQIAQDRGGVDGTYLEAVTAGGAVTTVWSSGTTFAGPAELVISAVQSGGNILVAIRFGVFSASTLIAGTLGRVRTAELNPDRHVFSGGQEFVVGQARVWDTEDIFPADTVTLFAHYSEAPGDRLLRLAAEDGITAVVWGESTDAMGSQPDGAPLDLYADCAASDLGRLVELRDVPGVGLRTRDSLYNQDPALVIDLATYETTQGTSGQVLAPVYDDQRLRTEVTVSRPGGSSATATDLSLGRYRDQVDINRSTDDVLADVAGMLTHLGTVDEPRHPDLPIDLAANPDLIDAWLCVDIGSRVQRTNVPAPHTGTIDQLVDGYAEVLGPKRWTVGANCSPASPWDVAEADGDARAPADGSTLAATLGAADMTLSLASTAANGVWSVDPADFPLDVRVGGVNGAGGERITLSGLSGGTSPQNATISARGVNGITRAWASGTSVDVWDPAIAPL